MFAAILQAYRQATQRLFLLDYDGTLSNYKPTPSEAVPTPQILQALNQLAQDPLNTVVILSGRDHVTLGDWLGHLPVTLMAEHGFYIRHKGSDTWQLTTAVHEDWKHAVRPYLQESTALVPGSLIEEKTTSLVWHYRRAEANGGEAQAVILAEQLQDLTQKLHINILQGNKNVEVRLQGMNKGAAAASWSAKQEWDFIAGAGDDVTDEELFEALPAAAYTIKIGPADTVARYRLEHPEKLLELLEKLQ